MELQVTFSFAHSVPAIIFKTAIFNGLGLFL